MTVRAAAVAATVAPAPQSGPMVLQRQCACGNRTNGNAECETCASKKKLLQRKSSGGSGIGQIPSIVNEVLRGPGRPLDSGMRAFMEPRFNHDFAHVRIHTDTKAAESAKAVNALAYTVGRDVVFGTGQYMPGTHTGRRLLAHELTHTIQQRGASLVGELSIGDAYASGEVEADRIADAVLTGETATPRIATAPQVQRQETGVAETAESSGSAFGPYDGCGASREQVEHARTESARLVGRALVLLDEQHLSQAGPLLAAHFHLDSSQPESRADLQLIRDQFTRMQQALNSGIRIFCRAAPSPVGGTRSPFPVDSDCRGGGSGVPLANSTSCAAGNATATVSLCEVAVTEMFHPLTKTLLHEFAHIACDGNPQIRSGGSAGHEVYYEGRLPGAETNVLVNADSYAWFAMEADRVAGDAGGSTTGAHSGNDHTGWGVMTGVGGALAVAGAIGLGYGVSQGSDAGIGLGIAGLALGAVGLGVGIAGLLGAFDSNEQAHTDSSSAARAAPERTTPATVSELSSMSAWQLAQLPESAFAASGAAATADSAGPNLADYARAWRLVRCIRDLVHLTVDPDTAGQLGRDPNAAEWQVLRQTLSQILAHSNVGALVQGPGGRGDVGTPAMANRVRVLNRVEWGVKRFQLENLVSSIGAGADPFVQQWWAEAQCGIHPGASPHIVDQERRMAVFHQKVMEGGLGSGGFYFPPDDTIYIGESMMTMLNGTGAEAADARMIAGHEMVHFVGGRERTRQAFIDYFHDEHWICYWSAFEEGMAEITTRDSLNSGQSGTDRGYEQFVQLMRQIMTALGEDRVRRAYFTGAPDREIFEQLRTGLPAHMDPGLPPVCRTPVTGGAAP